ncbi:uncharacterized protein PAN0_011c4269 [Moesziomyces antarcticus]|uniref:Uncharacterized protein n=2 Tax=Pseudozyma antarctica TaxID=84753 RepID=A0A5C3FR91_PSEA2|nr:uncharacterized protein PAN0_011c4269 [Moesziomyces antarcticus]GAK66047.1 hypothetical protein PAN0_011c4269 [Moesziomyces antarcticus]SPO46822.1 uncharacterized protein PSANT_04508 [Moesziomyces antarcticus]
MSIQPGLISPPVSGRTHKASQPRLGDVHRGLSAADVFGRPSDHDAATTLHHKPGQSYSFEHAHLDHPIQSPEKKLKQDPLGVPGAVRPPTPPMSRDVRHDDKVQPHHDDELRHRASSEGEHWAAPASSIALAHVTSATSALDHAHHTDQRFGTLTKGVAFESDDDHNPFLDRRPSRRPSSSSSEVSKAVAPVATSSHATYAAYDEYDSDQDAEGSVHDEDEDEDEHDFGLSADTTPRASSTRATTPPRRTQAPADGAGYRPARPLSAHVRVDNEDLSSVIPIRDTPMNPFLAGGPADNGFCGPRGHEARRRAQQIPGKERGKITYVFRGQKVTYADPEYDSDDDDSDDDDEERARINAFNPHHNPDRPPRLQPRLLFPPTHPSVSSSAGASGSRPKATRSYAQAAPVTKTSSSYLPFADLGEGKDEGSKGGGLFAAQIAAQDNPTSTVPATQPAAAGSQTRNDIRHAARAALLARLDQTNWSDDDEDDERQRANRRRGARDSSHDTAADQDEAAEEDQDDDEQVEVESHRLARTAKRRSDELQRGHQDSLDAMGRPLKRSRASYAY